MVSTLTDTGALSPDLIAALEQETGARIVGVVPRAGGGASRQGAELTFEYADGARKRCYLSLDTRRNDARRAEAFRREVSILKALSTELSAAGVKAPHFVAALPDCMAMATELAPGSDKFRDAAAPGAVAADFMQQLAILHSIAPDTATLEGFGTPNDHPSIRVRKKLADLRSLNERTLNDPVFVLALDWMEQNVPSDRGPEVIVHGDAGVGNFMHENGKVTALLDWELCHFGDPMEDLAQIWVRCLFQPFRPMRELFSAYEAAGGVPVDLDAVKFHRLYFQMGFTVPGQIHLNTDSDVEVALLGVIMMFNQAHMRTIVLSLAELMNIDLLPFKPEEAPPTTVDGTFRVALDDLRNDIVPSIGNQHGAAKAKSLARMVKYWRARERYGQVFDRAECAEVGKALNETFQTTADARKALSTTIASGAIRREDALQLCYRRIMRSNHMLADTMGRFADTYFPPLEETS